MASVYLFEPTNIEAPQWSVEQIERIYGPINLYSFNSFEFWAGTGEFGEGIDFRYDGYGLLQGTNLGWLTGIAGYAGGNPAFSIDEFSVPISDIANFTPGLPLNQLGIFNGSDYMSGSYGNDVLTGYRGADEIWGNSGDDLIKAGNGRDTIWGDDGSDVLYGGFGRNTFLWEDDDDFDQIFIKSDQFAYNYLYESAGNSPNGEKADIIKGLDEIDRIFVQGVATEQLSFGSVNHTFGDGQSVSGVGIFAQGVLEAVYTGGDLTAGQLQNMTSGLLI